MASSTSVVIALTWGGIQFPWTSAHVLVPLIVGLLGIGAWLAYEGLYATHPIVSSVLVCGGLNACSPLAGAVQALVKQDQPQRVYHIIVLDADELT